MVSEQSSRAGSRSMPFLEGAPSGLPVGMDVTNESDPLKVFEQEIATYPKGESSAFFDAKQKTEKKVWQEESNPSLFLRIDGHDVSRASRRFAAYWQLRLKLFGSKKFHMSLYQTGEDALGRKDLSILGSGFVQLLPDDSKGRSVIWIDSSRLPEGGVAASRDRCLFYMTSLLCENELSLTEGAVLIFNIHHPTLERLDTRLIKKLAETLPLRFKAIHLISPKSIPENVRSNLNFAVEKTHEYIAKSKDEVRLALQSFGVRKESG